MIAIYLPVLIEKSQFLILISYLDDCVFKLVMVTDYTKEDNDIHFTYLHRVYTKLGPSHHQFMFINN